MSSVKQYEKIAIEAAHIGAKILTKYFQKLKGFDIKKGSGIVTKADKESEEAVASFLFKKTPGFSILAEEKGLRKIGLRGKSAGKWIFDPLDGTTNFFHKVPHFNISIALELDGEVVVGVVYNPVNKELYHCTKKGGAYRNNERIHV